MLRVAVTVVQEIITDFNGAVLVEDKIMAFISTALNLVQQNGH
jgi:hypothetical protein